MTTPRPTRLRRRQAALAAAGLLLAAAAPPAAAQTLRIGVGAPATSLDPHFHNNGPNNALTMHLFDRLVERDAQARPQPALAESWTQISDTVWEFCLRRGVAWHDGRPFTADDVLFSFERAPLVPNSPGGFGAFLRMVAKAEAVDPHTLRIHTRQPHPLLPVDLGSVSIVSRHAGTGAGTEDYNSGRAAIGTGPYRLGEYRPGTAALLLRNEAWWGGAEPWARVEYRFLANDTARTAALLAGDVDVIDQIPSSDLARLKRDPKVTVSEIASLRTMFIAPVHSIAGNSPQATDHAGRPLPQNPFRDLRVRQALSLAIQRDALVDRVMEGAAQPTAQWLPAGAFGHNPAVTPTPFDPDRARALLAEAGYPEGFRLTLTTPNDRWPNDARLTQAVAQMWTRIGVRTTVEALPYSAFVPRRTRQEFLVQMAAWGSSTGEAINYLVSIAGTGDRSRLTGAANMWGWSDPALDAMTAEASATLDDAAREALLRRAVAHYDATTPYIQLLQLTNSWGLRRGLAHDPRMDERTVAMGIRLAP
ncbi:ABC transporter substrate-binding protein [Roseomonas sp. 18066]|uniref:ABC transporter substrate-binding protein n=1 Tax=Roseomonas sp. 18066 TaxID=2681412 RepID=UPI001359C84A|nr:ABC transporter substrate-binding protein [Roseomonas sp. 18066]